MPNGKSFSNDKYKDETERSNEVWNLKSTDNSAEIAWKIIRKYACVNRTIIKLNFCLNEKLDIATHQQINLLNKRSELVSKCRHYNKLLLMNFEGNIT